MEIGNERDVHIDEFLELLQETRKRERNLKIGVVYDITEEWNSKDNHSMGRWKHKQSRLYKIQLVTDELTLREED